MKMVTIEPLGVEEGEPLTMAREVLGDRVEIVYYNAKIMDTAELIERGKDTEVIVVSSLPLNVRVIEGYRNLKFLTVAFTGVDYTAMDACRKNGVMVCNCTGYSTCAMADLMFGMLIGPYRNVTPCDKVRREEDTKGGLVGSEPEGKTSDMVGTGAIGFRVTAIARAFGCRVLIYNRTVRDVPGVRYVDLETLLAECNVVSPHTPLTEEIGGLMNEECIGLMKKDAVFINTARRPMVDNDALTETLEEGRVIGACIGVSENELPVRRDHPLFPAPNTIVTPHAAFTTRKALVKRAVIVFNNVVNYLDGTPGNMIG